MAVFVSIMASIWLVIALLTLCTKREPAVEIARQPTTNDFRR
jgi:hypothetical protein